MKIIKSENRWLGPKIYEGVKNARGEIICPLDDDNLFLFKNPVKILDYFGREFIPPMPEKPVYVSNSILNKKIVKEALKTE